jgi:septal ring-binding cell division protein DamX
MSCTAIKSSKAQWDRDKNCSADVINVYPVVSRSINDSRQFALKNTIRETVSNPFFLTRQTAKLMDDLVRELRADASLFLLYGENGVGKTRLLEELKLTRLTDKNIHWIDLKAGGSGDGSLVDSSAMVEDIFARAQPGDIIVADHFEMALQKTRHQLFLSWSTDGVDKRINLIISSNDRFFDELQQLANQYQVRVQSFWLMALNPEEAVAFLGFYLFPERPIGKLSIPMILQEQLGLTRGAVGKIVEIAERAGDQITTAPMDDVETIRKDSKNMVGILIAVALLIGGGWYYLRSQSQTDDVPVAAIETLAPQQAKAPVGVLTRSESESMQATAQPDAYDAEPGASVASDGVKAEAAPEDAGVETVADEAPAIDEETLAVEAPVEDISEIAMMPEPGTASDEESGLLDETSGQQVEQRTASEVDAVPAQLTAEEMAATTPEKVSFAPAGVSRFDEELQVSLDWIKHSDKKIGTIQIMMLSHDKFDDRVYYDYVNHLATRGVDISELKIFMTYTGGRKVYSVVYGEYESWKAAGDAIEGLPRVLKDTSPIPRSAGGLMEEIRRLEAEN